MKQVEFDVNLISNLRLPSLFKDKLIEILNTCNTFSGFDAITKIILFGSAARGQLKCGSDLDICIVWDTNDDELVGKLRSQLQDDIPPVKVDVFCCKESTYLEQSKLIIKMIKRDGILLYEK